MRALVPITLVVLGLITSGCANYELGETTFEALEVREVRFRVTVRGVTDGYALMSFDVRADEVSAEWVAFGPAEPGAMLDVLRPVAGTVDMRREDVELADACPESGCVWDFVVRLAAPPTAPWRLEVVAQHRGSVDADGGIVIERLP